MVSGSVGSAAPESGGPRGGALDLPAREGPAPHAALDREDRLDDGGDLPKESRRRPPRHEGRLREVRRRRGERAARAVALAVGAALSSSLGGEGTRVDGIDLPCVGDDLRDALPGPRRGVGEPLREGAGLGLHHREQRGRGETHGALQLGGARGDPRARRRCGGGGLSEVEARVEGTVREPGRALDVERRTPAGGRLRAASRGAVDRAARHRTPVPAGIGDAKARDGLLRRGAALGPRAVGHGGVAAAQAHGRAEVLRAAGAGHRCSPVGVSACAHAPDAR
jgi:hypothetical protein